MKFWKKISIFVILSLVLSMVFATVAFATDMPDSEAVESEAVETEEKGDSNKLDMGLKPESFGERVEIVLQGFVTGMLSVFAVLALLWGIISVSKVFLYDIPNKKKNAKIAEKSSAKAPEAPAVSEPETPATVSEQSSDDGELAAVITAAIAAMIESGDYKNEFVGGFRVVSFKRSGSGAWNRK